MDATAIMPEEVADLLATLQYLLTTVYNMLSLLLHMLGRLTGKGLHLDGHVGTFCFTCSNIKVQLTFIFFQTTGMHTFIDIEDDPPSSPPSTEGQACNCGGIKPVVANKPSNTTALALAQPLSARAIFTSEKGEGTRKCNRKVGKEHAGIWSSKRQKGLEASQDEYVLHSTPVTKDFGKTNNDVIALNFLAKLCGSALMEPSSVEVWNWASAMQCAMQAELHDDHGQVCGVNSLPALVTHLERLQDYSHAQEFLFMVMLVQLVAKVNLYVYFRSTC